METLVDYIYATLGLDLDYVIPFAPVPEHDRAIPATLTLLADSLFLRFFSPSYGLPRAPRFIGTASTLTCIQGELSLMIDIRCRAPLHIQFPSTQLPLHRPTRPLILISECSHSLRLLTTPTPIFTDCDFFCQGYLVPRTLPECSRVCCTRYRSLPYLNTSSVPEGWPTLKR